MVFLKDFTEGVAGEVIEVALPPGGAPVRMIDGDTFHLGVVVREVNDDFRHTGFELLVPDKPATSPLPTAEQLRLLREEIDPKGVYLG